MEGIYKVTVCIRDIDDCFLSGNSCMIIDICMHENFPFLICYEMFLIIQLYLTCRKDCMQSATREEIMKLRMYYEVADVRCGCKCTKGE